MIHSISMHSHGNSSSETFPPVGVCPKTRSSICDSFVDSDRWQTIPDIPSPHILCFYHTAIKKLALARALKNMNLVKLFEKMHAFKLDKPLCPDSEVVCSLSKPSDVQRNLQANGLALKEITPDGNCFFSSVATSMLNTATQWFVRIGEKRTTWTCITLTKCFCPRIA